MSSAGLLVVLTGVLAARGNRRHTMVALVVLPLVGLGLTSAIQVPGGWVSVGLRERVTLLGGGFEVDQPDGG